MERKGDLKAVAWRRVERTAIVGGEWKQLLESGGECVFTLWVAFERGMEASS